MYLRLLSVMNSQQNFKKHSRRILPPFVRSCLLFCLLFFTVLWLSPAVVAAENSRIELTAEEQAWLAAHPNINLGTSSGYPPHTIKAPDGTITGFNHDLYEQISQILNTRVDLYAGDVWLDVQKKAENREIDGLALLGRDPNRDVLYNATDTVFPAYFSVFAASRHDIKVNSFSDLDGMRIGYKRGARPAKTRLEKLPSAILKPYDSHESMTQALLTKEIDVVVAYMSYDHWRKQTLQGTIDKVYLITEHPLEMVIYIRNDWPEFVLIMNKAIAALQQEALPKIIDKWFGWWPTSPRGRSTDSSVQLSDEERAWLKINPIVRARVSYYPPLMVQKPEVSGIAVEYLENISKRFGFRVEFIPDEIGFQAGLKDIMGEKKHFDLFLSLNRTPEREGKIAFSDNFISIPWVIYSRQDAEFISSMDDLNGKTVSVEQAYVMSDKLEKEYPFVQLLKVPTSLDALRTVATGQAEAYIGNLSNASWLIREHNLDNLKIAAPAPFGNHDLAMGVRSDWPELASIINKGMAAMSLAERNSIKNHWHSLTYKTEVDYSLLWQILLGAGLTGLAIIYWNKILRQQVQKRTAELTDSESRFRAIFEQAAVGIAHVAPGGRFLRLNQKFCDIVGYTHNELLNLKFQDITHPDDIDTDLTLYQQLLDGRKESYSLEKRYICKDSSTVWINLTVRVIREEDGTPRWFVSVIEDISIRKQAEDQVRKGYEFLQHLTTTVPDAIFSIKVPERTVLWCNDSYAVLGYETAECVGESTAKFYSTPEDAQKVGDLLDKAFKDNENLIRTEAMLRRNNGEIFPAELNIAVYRDANKVVSVTALVRDISERKQVEEALQQSHEITKHLISSIPDAVFSVKLPERVIEWFDDSYNVMGLGDNPEGVAGRSTADFFISIDDYDAFGELQREAIKRGDNFIRTEVLLRRSDKTIFPAEVTGTFYKENGEVKTITALARDISERKQAEQTLLDYQGRLKSLAFQLTLAEEQERRRIAAGLHDDVSQTLTLSRVQLAAAIADSKDVQQKEQLEEISQTLLNISWDTQHLIFELSSPTMHELGLGAAISEWAEEKLKKTPEIKFSLDNKLTENELDDEQNAILFRNVRELLTNTIKHARAQIVTVVLEKRDQGIIVTVKDDGIGFDPERIAVKTSSEGGFGIFSVEERMSDLGGKLEISSQPHCGCTMIMSMPIYQQSGSSV